MPPPPWPPETFQLSFKTDYTTNGELQHYEHEYTLTRQAETWDWFDNWPPAPPNPNALWRVREVVQQAELELHAYDNGVHIIAAVDVVDVVWDTSTIYVVTEWDRLQPAEQWATAVFTF